MENKLYDLSQISIIIPSYNPAEKLISTVSDIINAGFSDVIVVDDGSNVDNKHLFDEIKKHPQVTLLTHSVNKGKGAALKTAPEF